ncbi:MAG: hypothetical protein LBJ88_00250 [Campylobacteraceae bacterium]|jgi:hypothetical protein|nr:hypothetical protein [Campylobacteraceae bacterium]
MNKLIKLIKYLIPFFEDASKNHNVKMFEVILRQLFEKVKVTPPPPRTQEKNKRAILPSLWT